MADTCVTSDWSGSAATRRPQGGCTDYGSYPDATSKFTLPAGTLVSIARLDDPARRWTPHTTRKPVHFNKNEAGRSGAVVIREQGFLILARWNKIQRNQPRREPWPGHRPK